MIHTTKVRLSAHFDSYCQKESREVTKMTATSTTSSRDTPEPVTESESETKKRKKKKLNKELREQELRHGNT